MKLYSVQIINYKAVVYTMSDISCDCLPNAQHVVRICCDLPCDIVYAIMRIVYR